MINASETHRCNFKVQTLGERDGLGAGGKVTPNNKRKLIFVKYCIFSWQYLADKGFFL